MTRKLANEGGEHLCFRWMVTGPKEPGPLEQDDKRDVIG